MLDLHSLLIKQMTRLGINEKLTSLNEESYIALLKKISTAYSEVENDRYTIERAMDISSKEMKQLYANLKEEREKLQAVISEGLCFFDDRWKVMTINLEAEKIINKNQSDVKGYYMSDLFALYDEENRHKIQITHLDNTLATGKVYQCNRGKLIRESGEDIHVSFAFNPLFREKKYCGAILVFHDISERIKNEQALKKATKAAHNANLAKSQFLAKMSHEIRTPMNAILGMSELMLHTPLKTRQKKYIENILTSGKHLLKIINEILDFSKMEAGKLILQKKQFNLFYLVKEVVDLFANKIKENNLTLGYDIDKKVPYLVIGDPTRVQQIITNLLSNATKFTTDGEISLSIGLLRKTNSEIALLLKVKDTGIGIAKSELKTVFNEFEQSETGAIRKYGGTGLGLSIVKQLVELMGGTISIESKLNSGTTFTVVINLEEANGTVELPVLSKAKLKNLQAIVLSKHADDIAILLAAYQINYQIITTATEAETILMQQDNFSKKIDIIFIDIDNFANYHSFEKSAKKILKRDDTLYIHVSNDCKYFATFDPSGIDLCLKRPIRQSDLYNCIISYLVDIITLKIDGEDTIKKHFDARILVAEDNIINQQVIGGYLRLLKCTSVIVNDGEAAIKTLEKDLGFSLILMDCQMPKMDGYLTTRHIRTTMPEANHIPIIALTANAMKGDEEKCLAMGMDGYLAKPLTKETLIATFDKWLKPLKQDATEKENSGDIIKINSETTFNDNNIINENTLLEIESLSDESHPHLLQTVISQYFLQVTSLLDDMNDAIKKNDMKALRNAAHMFKSSNSNVGATHLSELCQQLETFALENNLKSASEILKEVIKQYPIVAEKLQKIAARYNHD